MRRRFLSVAAGVIIAFAPIPTMTSAAAAAPAGCTTSTPFTAGEGGYATYRIPAVVTAPDDVVLAFAEGRVGGAGDSGDIDIVLRRSQDGGCTWGPMRLVADLGDNTIGNPSPVVDPVSGDVVLVSTVNSGTATEDEIVRGEAPPRTVYVQRSTDSGVSWSAPTDISDTARLPYWRWYATGPGHALALTHGPHAGRLVVASDHSIAPPDGSTDTGGETKYLGGHSLYSDDGGRNWTIGYVDDNPDGYANVNETLTAELSDGRLYFNSRDQGGTAPGNRLDAYSTDGGETLERPFASQGTLWEVPTVQTGLLNVGRRGPLLFSGPGNPDARSAMTIWRSDDDGRTFQKVQQVSGLPAAYSDLVELRRNTIGLLYETGLSGTYETIEFHRIPVSGLR